MIQFARQIHSWERNVVCKTRKRNVDVRFEYTRFHCAICAKLGTNATYLWITWENGDFSLISNQRNAKWNTMRFREIVNNNALIQTTRDDLVLFILHMRALLITISMKSEMQPAFSLRFSRLRHEITGLLLHNERYIDHMTFPCDIFKWYV